MAASSRARLEIQLNWGTFPWNYRREETVKEGQNPPETAGRERGGRGEGGREPRRGGGGGLSPPKVEAEPGCAHSPSAWAARGPRSTGGQGGRAPAGESGAGRGQSCSFVVLLCFVLFSFNPEHRSVQGGYSPRLRGGRETGLGVPGALGGSAGGAWEAAAPTHTAMFPSSRLPPQPRGREGGPAR